MEKLKVLDLFSGIGGFSLGFDRAGMETRAFCEVDKHCRAILKKHWPSVPIYEDVKTLTGLDVELDCGPIDLICGGFPCQDISVAGKQKGLIDEKGNETRSGLWFEYKRIIGEIKPKYVVIENVAALRTNGLVVVLQDLWSLGYSSEWHIISARSVGAQHLRERVWVVAYLSDSDDLRLGKPVAAKEDQQIRWAETAACVRDWWEIESEFCGIPNGISEGLDKPEERIRKQRIKQLGNAIVPQIAELIGRKIIDFEIKAGEKWKL